MYGHQLAPGTVSTNCSVLCMNTSVLLAWIHTEAGHLCAPFIPTHSLSTTEAASVCQQHNKHIGYCALQQYSLRFGILLLHAVPSPSLCPTHSSLCTCLPPPASHSVSSYFPPLYHPPPLHHLCVTAVLMPACWTVTNTDREGRRGKQTGTRWV